MTLNQIEHVLAVAETGSMNKAAQKLFISQSVLSTSISNLEKLLGRKIFFRTNQGTELTEYGRYFVTYMEPVERQINQFKSKSIGRIPEHSMSVSIASNRILFLDAIATEIYEKYKSAGVQVKIIDCGEMEVANNVASGTADIGLVRVASPYTDMALQRFNVAGLDFFPLKTFDLGIAIGENNPLYHEPINSVSPEDLADFPLVITNQLEEGPFSDLIDLLELHASNNKFITTSDTRAGALLSTTDAYCLYSNTLANPEFYNQFAPKGIRTLNLEGSDITVTIGMVKLVEHQPTQLLSEVIALFSKYLSSSKGF